MHWRGIALTTFDGRRWYTEEHDPSALGEGSDGWITVAPRNSRRAPLFAAAPIHGAARADGFRRALRGFRAGAHSRRFSRPAAARPLLSPHLSGRGSDRLALQSFPQFSKPCDTKQSPRCPKSPRRCCELRPGRLSPNPSRHLSATAAGSIRASRRWPRQSPREPSILMTRPAPSKAIFATLRLHAGSQRHSAHRSAGLLPFPEARRPLRIFRRRHDRHDARAGHPRALHQRLSARRIQQRGRRLHHPRQRRS